jgi:probable pyridine nucleotide-disulfide oxidoreductase
MSENAARKQGRDFRVANMPMKNAPRTLEIGETRGFTKGIVDADAPHTLGCANFGLEGGEMMTIIPGATMGKLPYTALKGATFTPPTLAERPNSLFVTLDL